MDLGDASGRLGVADVGFHRADSARRRSRRIDTEGVRKTMNLKRVAQAGPGSVRLDIGDRVTGDTGIHEGRGHDLRLGDRIRDAVAERVTIVVHRGSENRGVDMVAVRDRLRKGLDQDRANALGGNVTVTAITERVTTAIARREAGFSKRRTWKDAG